MTISEDHGYMKPDKRIFEIAIKKIGAESLSQVLIVGDRLGSDILGGNLAGIHTCWMNRNDTLNTTGIKPTYTVKSLKNIETIL
jgi:FMN phosphatase YigB (HAD superfamily)